MNAIAADMEVSVEYIHMDWELIFTDLIAGNQDAVISGITITPEREEFIDFTLPYLAISDGQELGIAVQSGDSSLRQRMNEALWRLRADGTLGSIVQGVADDLELGPDEIFLPNWPLVYSDTETAIVYIGGRDTTTTLVVPVNAVNEPVMLVHTPIYTDTSPPGYQSTGVAFELDGYLDGSYLPGGIEFNQPVTLTLTYSDTSVTGLNEGNLRLYTWEVGSGAWVNAACGPYDFHPAENWLSVPICHASRFALMSSTGTIHLPLIVRAP